MKKCKRCGVELTVDNTKWPGLPREKMGELCISCFILTHPKFSNYEEYYSDVSYAKKQISDRRHIQKLINTDLEDSNE